MPHSYGDPRLVDQSQLLGTESPDSLYRSIVEASPDAIGVVDLAGKLILASPQAAWLLGYDRPEDLLGKSAAEFLDPADRAEFEARFLQRPMGVNPASFLCRAVHCLGHTIPCECRGALIRGADGEPRAVLFMARDLSEPQRARREADRMSRLYAFLLQVGRAIHRMNAPEDLLRRLCEVAVVDGGVHLAWVGLMTPGAEFLEPLADWSRSSRLTPPLRVPIRETGLDRLGAGVRVWDEIAAQPDDCPWRDEALRRGFHSVAIVPFQPGKDLTGALCLYADEPGFFSEEDRVLLEEIGEDISHALEAIHAEQRRREAEAALQRSESRLNHVLRTSPVTTYTIAVTPAGFRLESITSNVTAVLGYRPEEIACGDWWFARLHPDDHEIVRRLFERLLTEGRARLEYRFRHSDGTYRWIMDEAVLVRDAAGAPMEVVGAWADITSRREAEAERLELESRLRHSQKLESLGVLAGGIAHDFNNLLMAIMGNLDLATGLLSATSGARAHLEHAAGATRRAVDLTRQMLAYAGRGRPLVGPIDLNNLIRENAQFLRVGLSKSIHLDLRLESELPPVTADPGQALQVALNLITNAADAIGTAPGTITVTTSCRAFTVRELRRNRSGATPPAGRFLVLEVSDTGCGMDADVEEHLFDPFFTTKANGHGLGMSAILGIIRGCGGGLFVKTAPGAGSTFRVLFPASATSLVAEPGEPAGQSTRAPAPLASAARAGTVLVVDDEDTVRDVSCLMVQMLGLNPVAAGDGLRAVEIFDQCADEIDCVLLDLSMPGMDGLATLEALRERRPDVRVILSSGYDEPDIVHRLPGRGLVGFIQKPYSRRELAEMLDRVYAPPAG